MGKNKLAALLVVLGVAGIVLGCLWGVFNAARRHEAMIMLSDPAAEIWEESEEARYLDERTRSCAPPLFVALASVLFCVLGARMNRVPVMLRPAPKRPDSPYATHELLRDLWRLRDCKIITHEEFERKRRKMLERL